MNMKKYFELSMLQLLEQKSIDEITVNELVEEVGSCKGTFYKHYVDKYDLCCKALQTHVYSQFSAQVESWEGFMNECLEIFEKYAKVIAHAFESADVNSMRRYNKNFLTDALSKIVRKKGRMLDGNEEFSMQFCGETFTEILYVWLKDGRVETREQILNKLRVVMPQAIYNYVYND